MITYSTYRVIASLSFVTIFKDSARMFCLSNSCCKHNLNPICRKSNVYSVGRFNVPDNKASWSIPWKLYLPNYFTAEHLKHAQWADPEMGEWVRFLRIFLPTHLISLSSYKFKKYCHSLLHKKNVINGIKISRLVLLFILSFFFLILS